jgi:cobalt-zinc-cadmium efflux system outer membrane protein
MDRQWSLFLGLVFALGATGCAHIMRRPEPDSIDAHVKASASLPAGVPAQPMAMPLEPGPSPPELSGPQPVDIFIRRALVENRTVQAAYHNVESLRHRIPQVTALDDPVASNVVFPIPSVAPQYFLMGYNPYNLTLAQQFPWFGTLRLRGEAAERDVHIALAELAAAQLDAVAAVKRAYYNLYASSKTEEILTENRKVLEAFRATASQRLATGSTQQDVLRSEVLISELDRELANNQQGVTAARAALARQIHVRADAGLQTLPELALAAAPVEIERLTSLAIAARPELQGRLAAVARDEKAVELARKRFYPNITLGLTYMDMEKTNAIAPKAANGSPNVGLFVAFNLPVYRQKYQAGVCEAQERASADAKLYEAQRDETYSEIQDLMMQAKVQQNVLSLLRDSILPRTRKSLDLARSDFVESNVNYATLLSALREVLQVQMQIAQVEAELGKALASLERVVGAQINEHPPTPRPAGPAALPATPSTTPAPAPSPPAENSPFRAGIPPAVLRSERLGAPATP